ncbi:flavodoxin domain-containing protein [Actinomadura sp. NPDC048955]|uniref:flavodoxin domain-containing protein n=1 Tax=Actinomadura TaxID=1988 RepID=UPI00216492CA|nr:flavodoxin domain-containing protein [Actinomadura glauciflava]MCR3741232.1 menaquinone-dependent protoporphyrinogen oxidase [Actinomadura glauciflava]
MIRVLVAFASERGGTAEIAEWVGAALRDAGVTADVRPAGEVESLDGYDAVVVGGALYVGRWHREARRFVRHHADGLAHRPVWLFSSGPLDRSAQERAIDPVPGVAKFARRVHARGHATFGGRLAPDARGFMAAKVARTASGDFRDRDRVGAWAAGIARDLRSVTV